MSGVRIDGLNQLVRGMQKAGVEVDDLKGAFGAISDEGARLMSSFAPRRSGALAGTIRGNRAKNKAVVMAGKGKVRWAGSTNWGWPASSRYGGKPRRGGGWPLGMRAQMYTAKTDEALEPYALEQLDQNLTELIRSVGL